MTNYSRNSYVDIRNKMNIGIDEVGIRLILEGNIEDLSIKPLSEILTNFEACVTTIEQIRSAESSTHKHPFADKFEDVQIKAFTDCMYNRSQVYNNPQIDLKIRNISKGSFIVDMVACMFTTSPIWLSYISDIVTVAGFFLTCKSMSQNRTELENAKYTYNGNTIEIAEKIENNHYEKINKYVDGMVTTIIENNSIENLTINIIVPKLDYKHTFKSSNHYLRKKINGKRRK